MTPLAEKMRPKSLDEVIGQEHLTGANDPSRNHRRAVWTKIFQTQCHKLWG